MATRKVIDNKDKLIKYIKGAEAPEASQSTPEITSFRKR